MNDEIILNQLKELAEKLGILVRDENLNAEEYASAGGLCRFEGKSIIILNSKSQVKEKKQVMIKSLRNFNISEIYIKPVIRELFEGYEEP